MSLLTAQNVVEALKVPGRKKGKGGKPIRKDRKLAGESQCSDGHNQPTEKAPVPLSSLEGRRDWCRFHLDQGSAVERGDLAGARLRGLRDCWLARCASSWGSPLVRTATTVLSRHRPGRVVTAGAGSGPEGAAAEQRPCGRQEHQVTRQNGAKHSLASTENRSGG